MARGDQTNGGDRAAAEKRLADARAELEAAQQRAAEAGAGLAAATTRNIPEMEVEVLPGNLVSHEDKAYYGEGYALAPEGHEGNDRLTLDGPTALSLMQQGHVTLVGVSQKGGKA